MQVVVNGLVTTYTRSGKGKTLLFIHGWGDTSATYSKLIKNFDNKYDCIALDLPGHGKTDPPKSAWDLDNYSEFLSSFLSKIQAKPFAAVGHSNGGALLIRAISLGKIKPQRVVLMASAGIRDRGGARRLLVKAVAKSGKVLTFWLPKSSKKKLQKSLYGAIGSDMLVLPELKETFKLTVKQDVQVDAKNVNAPTLLIYGNRDRATPVKFGEIYKSLMPKADLEVLSGEHFIHHDQTDEVTALIEGFLK